jgi:hypothetical protein
MAAISLIVLTRAGVAAARVALAVGRLPLDPSELTVYRLLVDAAPHDSTRLANQRAMRGASQPVHSNFCATQCNGLHRTVARAFAHLLHSLPRIPTFFAYSSCSAD